MGKSMVIYDRIQCRSPAIFDGSLPGIIPYNDVVFINIKNKEKHNALTPQTLQQIAQKIEELQDSARYVVLYPGTRPVAKEMPKTALERCFNRLSHLFFPSVDSLRSEGSFSAGADVSLMASQKNDEVYRFVRDGQMAIERIERSPLVKIAAIDGYCIGGGCEIAMACNYRISTPDAKFMMPEKRLGILPGWGGCSRLQRHIGVDNTLKMLDQGEKRLPTRAAQAYEMGLIDYIVPSGDIAEQTFRMILNGEFKTMPSRSLNSQDKSPILPLNDEEEAQAFAYAFRNGTPEGMRKHLEMEARRQ